MYDSSLAQICFVHHKSDEKNKSTGSAVRRVSEVVSGAATHEGVSASTIKVGVGHSAVVVIAILERGVGHGVAARERSVLDGGTGADGVGAWGRRGRRSLEVEELAVVAVGGVGEGDLGHCGHGVGVCLLVLHLFSYL